MAAANLITHELGNKTILQRSTDGYWNATALCKAAGKEFAHYRVNKQTTDFLTALSGDIGIPMSDIIQTIKGGRGQQGTWIHPLVAVNLAQWLSPEFSVKVSKWVFEWTHQGKTPTTDPDFLMIHKSVLQDTGRALVWMGDYGVTSQPYYGGAQPPFIDGRPVTMLGDSSERYYLTRYIGNVMDSQYLASEEVMTNHMRRHFPALEVVNRETMRNRLMRIASDITSLSGQFITKSEINKGLDKLMTGGV